MSRRPEGLLRASGITFAGIVVGAFATLLLAQVVGHGLGARGTGLFFQAIALFAIASNALQLGADTALVRTLSRQSALGETRGLRRTVRTAVVPVTLVGVAFSVVVLLAAGPLGGLVAPGDPGYATEVLRIMSPFLVAGALLAVLLGGTRGIGSTLPYTVLQNLGLPILRLLIVAFAMAAGWSIQWIAAGWAAPLAVLAVAAAVVLARQLRNAEARGLSPVLAEPSGAAAGFWGFALPRGASTLIERALDWSGVLIVLAVGGPVAGGIYAVVNRCASAGTMIDQAARIVTGPRISRALATRNHAEASRLFLDVTRGIVAVAWPFYLTLAVFAPAVLSLFGPEFVAGALPLALVSLAMMLATTAGMVQSILLMGGRSSWQLINRLAQLATLLVLTALLVPPLGLTGAAIGWIAAIAVDTTLAAVQVNVRLGIRSSPRLIVLPAALALLVFGGGGGLAALVFGESVPVLLTASAVLGGLYVALGFAFRRRLGLDVFRRPATPAVSSPPPIPLTGPAPRMAPDLNGVES